MKKLLIGLLAFSIITSIPASAMQTRYKEKRQLVRTEDAMQDTRTEIKKAVKAFLYKNRYAITTASAATLAALWYVYGNAAQAQEDLMIEDAMPAMDPEWANC